MSDHFSKGFLILPNAAQVEHVRAILYALLRTMAQNKRRRGALVGALVMDLRLHKSGVVDPNLTRELLCARRGVPQKVGRCFLLWFAPSCGGTLRRRPPAAPRANRPVLVTRSQFGRTSRRTSPRRSWLGRRSCRRQTHRNRGSIARYFGSVSRWKSIDPTVKAAVAIEMTIAKYSKYVGCATKSSKYT
jgi:hypothetical protein